MNSIRTAILYSLLAVIAAISSVAPSYASDTTKVNFTYNLDYETRFDNREFFRSAFTRSMTIFGARLTPSVGVELSQPDNGMSHRMMVGIDIMKDFGASPVSEGLAGDGSPETLSRQQNLDLLREVIMYYRLEKRTAETTLGLYAGIFPRSAAEGAYSEAFFSDSLRFYDNNLEGILFKVTRPKSYFEVGCDWLGKQGIARKEKFMIFSAAEKAVTKSFHLGYAAYMYHFAGSKKARGVVDNILMNPYARLDLSDVLSLDRFTLRLGYLQGMQHDRVFVGHYVFPCGCELDLDMSKWNVGIRNKIFYGTDMMPYYNSTDAAGDKYGTRLYMGDPFYRVFDEGRTGAGIYDRFDIYYQPYTGRNLSIRIEARFHFNSFTYSGCQQMVTVCFDLDNI
jgi:hypothetical protein